MSQPTKEKKTSACRAAFLRWCKRKKLYIDTWSDGGGNLWAAWQSAWEVGRRTK